MTLIATAISKYGIIHAADSRLTTYPSHVTAGPRVFALGFASAAVSVTGGYEVDGLPLDGWMVKAVDDYRLTAELPTLSGFAECLRERLSPQSQPRHRRMIHVAGYSNDGHQAHPEHYFVRNVRQKTRDGRYGRPGGRFHVTEEFWTRDYLDRDTRETIASGGAHIYLNGYPAERIAYMLLNQRIHGFYQEIWASSSRYRRPRSLIELARFIELSLDATATFLGVGDHADGRMTSPLEVKLIAPPVNVANLD